MEHTYTEIDGLELKDGAIAFRDALAKKNPELVFKPVEGQARTNGRNCNYFDVSEVDDPTFRLGSIGQFHDGEFWFNYLQMENGRWHYETQFYTRRSKHMASALKEAFKHIKSPSFNYVMTQNKQKFEHDINALKGKISNDIGWKLGRPSDFVIDEMIALADANYQAKHKQVQEVMDYVKTNREYINKYRTYDPDWMGIWVRKTKVLFKRKSEKTETIVATRDDLPTEIKEKMAVLDIMDERKLLEDVGLKDQPNIYWVLL